jgi:hypothetical protein
MFRHDPGRWRETQTGHMTAPVILTEARPGYGKALVLGPCLSRSAGGSQVSSLRACQVPGG